MDKLPADNISLQPQANNPTLSHSTTVHSFPQKEEQPTPSVSKPRTKEEEELEEDYAIDRELYELFDLFESTALISSNPKENQTSTASETALLSITSTTHIQSEHISPQKNSPPLSLYSERNFCECTEKLKDVKHSSLNVTSVRENQHTQSDTESIRAQTIPIKHTKSPLFNSPMYSSSSSLPQQSVFSQKITRISGHEYQWTMWQGTSTTSHPSRSFINTFQNETTYLCHHCIQ
jgi:hypothetical protein